MLTRAANCSASFLFLPLSPVQVTALKISEDMKNGINPAG